MERIFPLGDVLTAATMRMLCEKPYAIVGYMWDQLCDSPIEYMAMAPEAKLWIQQQYPQFSDENLVDQLADLDRRMENLQGMSRKTIALKWLAELIPVFGDKFSVTQIPPQNRRPIDHVEETRLIVPPDRIIEI